MGRYSFYYNFVKWSGNILPRYFGFTISKSNDIAVYYKEKRYQAFCLSLYIYLWWYEIKFTVCRRTDKEVFLCCCDTGKLKE